MKPIATQLAKQAEFDYAVDATKVAPKKIL